MDVFYAHMLCKHTPASNLQPYPLVLLDLSKKTLSQCKRRNPWEESEFPETKYHPKFVYAGEIVIVFLKMKLHAPQI